MNRRRIGLAEVREELRISHAGELQINGGAGWALARLRLRIHSAWMARI